MVDDLSWIRFLIRYWIFKTLCKKIFLCISFSKPIERKIVLNESGKKRVSPI